MYNQITYFYINLVPSKEISSNSLNIVSDGSFYGKDKVGGVAWFFKSSNNKYLRCGCCAVPGQKDTQSANVGYFTEELQWIEEEKEREANGDDDDETSGGKKKSVEDDMPNPMAMMGPMKGQRYS